MPGRLLFEYRPPGAHPILYAGLLVFAVVAVTGSLENAARDGRAVVYAVYQLPLLLTALVMVAWWPNPTRIYDDRIAPSRPLLLRWRRPFVAWTDLVAVYPSYYDVTGAFVSPFASSDGKVTQLGLALEWPDGRVETVRFTPTRFQMWQPESQGYLGALEAVRHAFGERPLVAQAEAIDREDAARLMSEAQRPFLPFWAIVFLFASAAPVIWVLLRTGVQVGPALALGLVAPVAVSLRSYLQSQRRHAILNRLSKAAEHRRGQRGEA